MRHVGETRREGPRREFRLKTSAPALGGMAEQIVTTRVAPAWVGGWDCGVQPGGTNTLRCHGRLLVWELRRDLGDARWLRRYWRWLGVGYHRRLGQWWQRSVGGPVTKRAAATSVGCVVQQRRFEPSWLGRGLYWRMCRPQFCRRTQSCPTAPRGRSSSRSLDLGPRAGIRQHNPGSSRLWSYWRPCCARDGQQVGRARSEGGGLGHEGSPDVS